MTQNQTRVLGLLRHQHRLAVVGGAGSGKRWLALGQARRLAKEDQSVVLVCYLRGLARFLQGVTAEWKPRERPSYVVVAPDPAGTERIGMQAGSGKRWLALGQARRLAKEDQSVVLVCYLRGLARFLQGVTAEWKPRERPSYVGLFHRLPLLWGTPQGEENDSSWFEDKLPALLGQLAVERPAVDRFEP